MGKRERSERFPILVIHYSIWDVKIRKQNKVLSPAERGALGGKAGMGKSKARTSEQARRAVQARWADAASCLSCGKPVGKMGSRVCSRCRPLYGWMEK